LDAFEASGEVVRARHVDHADRRRVKDQRRWRRPRLPRYFASCSSSATTGCVLSLAAPPIAPRDAIETSDAIARDVRARRAPPSTARFS
jgi:hypothetical protein